MLLDGVIGNVQLSCDFLPGIARSTEQPNFPFAVGQSIVISFGDRYIPHRLFSVLQYDQ